MVFSGIYRAPQSWTERSYCNLIYFHDAAKGAHSAAGEQPETAEIRAALDRSADRRPCCKGAVT
jgi:hypothetical protein